MVVLNPLFSQGQARFRLAFIHRLDELFGRVVLAAFSGKTFHANGAEATLFRFGVIIHPDVIRSGGGEPPVDILNIRTLFGMIGAPCSRAWSPVTSA